ncbi:MAG: hypothetical protein K8J08_06315 [Thermoanaerobaculia bacterium]|nr:hypothetical protein [Thermoanaerobaculia bacterium]
MSHELADLRCETELTRRQVTLFANGTVRVKEGLHEEMDLRLAELDPVTLRGYTERLAELDFSEVEASQILPTQGAWVEECELDLDIPDVAKPLKESLGFTKFDSLPLSLKRAVDLLEDLAAMTNSINIEQLPVDYEPRTGDVLRRKDGQEFRIIGLTSDGKAIEFQGVVNPLTLYLDVKHLRQQFIGIVSRHPGFEF